MNQQNTIVEFDSLEDVATNLRASQKKYILLFVHNRTGKTRLSRFFEDSGQDGDNSDTL